VALRRRGQLVPGRRTAALGVAAGLAFAAVLAGEIGRVWRRGRAPLPRDTDDLLTAAEEAVAETVEVARAGYQEVSTRENALFNLLASFVASFGLVRSITWLLRKRRTVGPFRDLMVGRRHIHHFVPGIVLAFAAGGVAIVTRDERIEPKLAFLFGTGMGMTLDESALLLELDDVYWSREGLLSVEIALSVTAALASLALALRLLRRGEEIVLDDSSPLTVPEAAR
jgi:hypothetical protein